MLLSLLVTIANPVAAAWSGAMFKLSNVSSHMHHRLRAPSVDHIHPQHLRNWGIPNLSLSLDMCLSTRISSGTCRCTPAYVYTCAHVHVICPRLDTAGIAFATPSGVVPELSAATSNVCNLGIWMKMMKLSSCRCNGSWS